MSPGWKWTNGDGSPGETPLRDSAHVRRYADMWRMADDFWDSWNAILKMFDYARQWEGVAGNGHWPDCDMMQIGRISKRGPVGPERWSLLTEDELKTHMTFWCIYRSPLMLGGNLPENRPFETQLLTNPEVLAVDQQGNNPRQLYKKDGKMIWASNAAGSKMFYVGLFNIADSAQDVRLDFASLGLKGKLTVRDLWQRSDAGVFQHFYSRRLPAHGSALISLIPF